MTLALGLLAPSSSALAAPALEPPPAAPAVATEGPAEPAEPREVPILRVEASEDEVILLDGSFVRGKVMEVAKGSHVTIALDELRKIPWAEVQEVRLGTAPTRPATAPTPTPAAVSPTPTREDGPSPGPGRPRVHIESRNGKSVTLYEVEGEFVGAGSGFSISGITYRAVCSGTCDRVVDGAQGSGFFVGGEGLTASRRFSLVDDDGNLTLDVRPGRRAMRYTGLVLAIMGASILPSGILMAVAASSAPTFPGLRSAGIGMAVGGGVMLGAGIPLALLGRTIVKKRRSER